jgi:hypothetical protein
LNREQRLRGASPEGGAGRTGRWLHVEKHMFDVARFIEADQALGEGFDLVF